MTLPSAAKITSRTPVEIDGFKGAYIERQIPPGTARGGSPFEHEIRWAIDAIQRGDTDLAINRLKRILNALSSM